MPKPFITYDQQIALLKSKHLIITDEDTAKRILVQIGYSSLIGGYKHPFKKELTKEIDHFSRNCSSLLQSDLLSEMGFPSNWKNISRRYKL